MYKSELQNYTVNINSKDRINVNDPSSSVKILIRDLINLNSKKATYLTVSQIILPPTLNNISAQIGNNVLTVTEDTVPSTVPLTYNIVFPDGNYSQSSFANALVILLDDNSALSGYAQTYQTTFDSASGKMSVNMTGHPAGFTFAFTFDGTNGAINEMLGFPNHTYQNFTVVPNAFRNLISSNAVNYAYPQAVFLRTNKMKVDGNYDSSSGNPLNGNEGSRGATGDILKVVPIYTNGFSSIIYNSFEGFPDQRLDISNLINSTLEFRLTDQFGTLIDLNNYDWVMTLNIQYSKEIK
jgi:hypothetical protein